MHMSTGASGMQERCITFNISQWLGDNQGYNNFSFWTKAKNIFGISMF